MQEQPLQAAGHGDLTFSSRFKSAVCKPSNRNEVYMYAMVEVDPMLASLKPFLPVCYGASLGPEEDVLSCAEALTVTTGSSDPSVWATHLDVEETTVKKEDTFVVHLENLLDGLQEPAQVMDVKVGRIRHHPRSDPMKKAKILKKDAPTTQPLVGLRLCGLVGSNRSGGGTSSVDRDEGRTLTVEGLRDAIQGFCGDEERRQSVATTVAGLGSVLGQSDDTLSDKTILTSYAFVSASVLLVKGGDGTVKASLIDFGQSGPRYLHHSEDELQLVASLSNLVDMLLT